MTAEADQARAAELQAAEASYRAAAARTERARRERNRVVLNAIAAGWTHAQISKATGLTRSRVGQIALGKDWGDG